MFKEYSEFVDGVTSDASKDLKVFVAHLVKLDKTSHVNIPRLITGGIGMNAEAGEFADIVKKLAFHGKMIDGDTEAHLKKELGDVFWYWIQNCIALNLDPMDVIAANQEKLEARYKEGKFTAAQSATRKEGDI